MGLTLGLDPTSLPTILPGTPVAASGASNSVQRTLGTLWRVVAVTTDPKAKRVLVQKLATALRKYNQPCSKAAVPGHYQALVARRWCALGLLCSSSRAPTRSWTLSRSS